MDNLWYNNCLKCQSLSMRTCNSFQSHLVHPHFDRSEITDQVTNKNLRGMGVLLRSCHNYLWTKNQGISWMFFPILWGQFPSCSGYGLKWVLLICRMILTGKDFFLEFYQKSFIMKNLADFRKTMETSVHLCLSIVPSTLYKFISLSLRRSKR